METYKDKKFLSTKEVAEFIGVNEKMVYSLIAEKGLPATKITGKWLFPRHLVEQWVDAHTINCSKESIPLSLPKGVVIIVGSNDPLLECTIALFNAHQSKSIAVFGNLGSMGGVGALRKGSCHIATSHLLQEDSGQYNFHYAADALNDMPAVVNFCRREQGLLTAPGNPRNITTMADLGQAGLTIVNRPLGTGTRMFLDRELERAKLRADQISGYQHVFHRHLDVGLEILKGNADTGPGIRPVATMLGLDFLPCRWEHYDLLIPKSNFFNPGVQRFINFLHESAFQEMASRFEGYDLSFGGKMVFAKVEQ